MTILIVSEHFGSKEFTFLTKGLASISLLMPFEMPSVFSGHHTSFLNISWLETVFIVWSFGPLFLKLSEEIAAVFADISTGAVEKWWGTGCFGSFSFLNGFVSFHDSIALGSKCFAFGIVLLAVQLCPWIVVFWSLLGSVLSIFSICNRSFGFVLVVSHLEEIGI